MPTSIVLNVANALAYATTHNDPNLYPISIYDNATDIAANVAQLRVLGLQITDVHVTDTAANINANQANLLSLGSELKDFTIQPDNTYIQVLSTDGSSITSGAGFAARIMAEGLTIPVRIADYGANIAANIDAIVALGPQLLSLQETYGFNPFTWAINVTDLLAVAGKTVDYYGYTEDFSNVTDSAANVFTHLDALEAISGQITKVTLTDTTTPNVSLTAAQFTNDQTVLNTIASKFNFTVNGVGAANATSILSALLGSNHNQATAIAITDTAANISAQLDSLQTNINKINSISLTDSNPIAVTFNQLTQDAKLLNKINTLYSLAVTGVSVVNMASVLAKGAVTSVAVSDTAAHIFTALDTLQTNVAKISAIAVTNPTAAKEILTVSQAQADWAALNLITGSYGLIVNGVSVSLVQTMLGNSHVTGVGLSDSSAHILAGLDSLLAPNIAKISGIALTDTSIPNLAVTASQFANDMAVFSKISSQYTLGISGETAAHVAADAKNSHVTAIGVVDSLANVNISLAALHSNVSKLSGIALTDASTATLSLGAAQTNTNLGVLNAIQSPYLLSVKDTVANINNLALSAVHSSLIEIMPTSLATTLNETSHVTDLNLSMIKLTGDAINEKVYNTTGTEVDIVSSANGATLHQLFFSNDSESQLHLLGIGNTAVHIL